MTMGQGLAKAITLASTDPNGDPLSYTVTAPAADGQLGGSGQPHVYPECGLHGQR